MLFALDCSELSNDAVQRRLDLAKRIAGSRTELVRQKAGNKRRLFILLPYEYTYTRGFETVDEIIEVARASWSDVWVKPKGGSTFSTLSNYNADFFGLPRSKNKSAPSISASSRQRHLKLVSRR